jgi:GNAT superfamily N-acetyltransferase
LKPLAQEWLGECNCEEFGIKTNIEKHLSELVELVDRDNAALILLISSEEEIAGYMGIEWFLNPLCDEQRIANEHYFYISKKFRGASRIMMQAAEDWARLKRCSHLIMNASCMASDMHDKVCRLYEHSGMKKFETSYIKEVI